MPKDETVSSPVPAKTYTYVQPRIDPEWYQAEIPYAFKGPLPVEAVQSDWFDASRKIYSNQESKDAKKNFLIHTRNLFERRKLGVSRQLGDDPAVVWKKEQVSFPLESDEAVIEFLAKHKYDINKAKFYLACIMSGGRDVVHARRMRQQLAKIPSASIAQRLDTLFLDHNRVWMHGAYANHSGAGEYIADPSGEGVLFLPDFGTGDADMSTPRGNGNSNHRDRTQLQSDMDSSINVHNYEVDVFSRKEDTLSAGDKLLPNLPESSSEVSTSAVCDNSTDSVGADKPHRDKTDKTVMKKKWSQIGKNISSLVSSVKSSYGGVSRTNLETVHEHLTAAFAALPVPSDMVLGFDLNSQLLNDVPKVVENYVMCKEWIGEVYDMLCPLALVTNDITPCDYKKLKQLLSEGEGLPFRCVFEENNLKRVIKDIDDVIAQGKAVLMDATDAASALSSNLFENLISSHDAKEKDAASSGSTSSSTGGSRNRSKGGSSISKSSRKNMTSKERDELKLTNLLASDMKSFGEDKIDIYRLNNILLSCSCLPNNVVNLPDKFTWHWEGAAAARNSDTPTYPNCPACLSSLAPSQDGKAMATLWDSLFLAALQKQNQKLEQSAENAVVAGNDASSVVFCPIVSASDVDTLQLLYLGAVELNTQIDHLLSMATLIRHKKYFSTQASLSSLVNTFLTCASYPVMLFGMSDLQRIIIMGVEWNNEVVEACKPNAPLLSLNRLDALISEGELLPIDFAKELEALREKRGAGKVWLDKFRKSMSSNASRASREAGDGSGAKMNLQSIKKLIEEGGQLYEDRKNKDLGKAMNMVDDAEDLINRVKGIISGEAGEFDGNAEENGTRDLEALKELLDETENMPVAMEEVQLLRAHIETVEWAEKARPILNLVSKTSDVEDKPKKRYRVSTLLKLQKELLKTRATMSPEMKKQFQAIKFKLPEETKLLNVIAMIEKFHSRFRKRFAGCGTGADDLITRHTSLRASVTLCALRQMIADMNEILTMVDLDFDAESEHLHTHVNAAEAWLRKHQETLSRLDIKVTSLSESSIRNNYENNDDSDDERGDTHVQQMEEIPSVTDVVIGDFNNSDPPGETSQLTVVEGVDATVNVLDLIDTIDVEALVDYETLHNLVDNCAESVLSIFPEITAAKMRLEDVDTWLEEINSYQPQQGDESSSTSSEIDYGGLITSSELEGMVSTGFEYKVNLLDEMKRVREWIRQAEKWEVDAQPAFAAILESVEATVGQLCAALAPTERQRHQVSTVADGGDHSFVSFPFLEGLHNSLDDFKDIFSFSSDDLHSCLKSPEPVAADVSSADNLMDVEISATVASSLCLSSAKQLEVALQPIIRLHRTINDSMLDLMSKRRQQVGGIVLTYSGGSVSSAPINLGILLQTLLRLMNWIQQIESLLTISKSVSFDDCQWGDIHDDIVEQALKDISKIASLDLLQTSFDEQYKNTLLHSSIPLDYFHASPAGTSLDGGDSNVDNADDKMDTDDEERNVEDDDGVKNDADDDVDVMSPSHKSALLNKSPRSNKKRRSSDIGDVDSTSKRQAIKKQREDSVLANKDFVFEKHSTRKSKKKAVTNGASAESIVAGVDADTLAESSSPVAAHLFSLYHDYAYPSYKPVQFSASARELFRLRKGQGEGFDSQILPTPILQLVDVWVRMLNLLLVRKEEASLFVGVADDIIKMQLAEKTYKGAKIAPPIKGSGQADPLYRPHWHNISFTSTYAEKVRALILWGSKRNIALRLRRVIDHRFGQSNLWLQVAQVYLSKKITEQTFTVVSSKYVIKPVALPLTPPVARDDANSGQNPFNQLLKPLEAAILQPISIEVFPIPDSMGENETDIKSEESEVRFDHKYLFQNNVIPKLTLEEMQMFIQSAETGGGLLSTDSNKADEGERPVAAMTPLNFLKELVVLPQPLLFQNSKVINGLKDLVRLAKEWVERFQQLQEIQQLQAAGASAEDVIPKAGGNKKGHNNEEKPAVNVNELCDKLIAEAQQENSLLSSSGIDLSEYLEQIMQVTQVFCLCRLPYHGFMVGCDHCDDWLHGSCIGVSKVQAERAEKYSCLRCTIKASANAGFQSIAGIVSLWMAPEDAIKHLETKRYRVSKKVSKEETELNDLLAQLPVAQSSALGSIDGVPSSSVLIDGTGDVQTQETMDINIAKLKALEENIEAARAKLSRALSEEVEIKKFYTLDMQGRLAWNQWMVLVRDILWTQGVPPYVGCEGKGAAKTVPIEDQILHATHRARELGIIDFPDIVNILNLFRWVSFCYLAMNLLRGPPTVKQLEFLLSMTKKLKINYIDEKMIKSITGLLNRARAWKAKCKKILSSGSHVTYVSSGHKEAGSHRKIEDMVVMLDENKAKSLYEEGTLCLSVRTRLRDQFRDAIHAHNMAKEESKLSDSKDSKGSSNSKDGSNNRSRGAQKFSVKDVMSEKAVGANDGDGSTSKMKIVLPAFLSAKTGDIGYYSSDEDDSDIDDDLSEARSELSELDQNVYRVRFPSQRRLNPIPQHQLSASVATAIQYPPTLNPVTSPPSKSYQPNYRHIGLTPAASARRQSVTKQPVSSVSCEVGKASVSSSPMLKIDQKERYKNEQKEQSQVIQEVVKEAPTIVKRDVTVAVNTDTDISVPDSTSSCPASSAPSSMSTSSPTLFSAGDIVVTDEMMHTSLMEVAAIMGFNGESSPSDQILAVEELLGRTSASTSSQPPSFSGTNPPAPLVLATFSPNGEKKAMKPRKEKKDKVTNNPIKDKDKEKEKDNGKDNKEKAKDKEKDTDKTPKIKKDKDPSVKGEAKKAALKAASGESKKRQREANKKARALLESINTGVPSSFNSQSSSGDDDQVPKTMDDALKKGALFVEMKRQKGVEALKESIHASLMKRKQVDESTAAAVAEAAAAHAVSSYLASSSSSSSSTHSSSVPPLAAAPIAILGESSMTDEASDEDEFESPLAKRSRKQEGGEDASLELEVVPFNSQEVESVASAAALTAAGGDVSFSVHNSPSCSYPEPSDSPVTVDSSGDEAEMDVETE